MQTFRQDIALVTSTTGGVTAYSSVNISARVLSVTVSLPTTNAIVATGVITVSSEVTGQTVWQKTATGSRTVAPKQKNYTNLGALFATGAGAPSPEFFYLGNERLKVVVAGGGSAKTGTVRVITG